MNAAIARIAGIGLVALAPLAWAADDGGFSGFLGDYSNLEQLPDDSGDLIYVAPGAFQALANYDAIMVDQPEIFLHPESKYKGMKPEKMQNIGELFPFCNG